MKNMDITNLIRLSYSQIEGFTIYINHDKCAPEKSVWTGRSYDQALEVVEKLKLIGNDLSRVDKYLITELSEPSQKLVKAVIEHLTLTADFDIVKEIIHQELPSEWLDKYMLKPSAYICEDLVKAATGYIAISKLNVIRAENWTKAVKAIWPSARQVNYHHDDKTCYVIDNKLYALHYLILTIFRTKYSSKCIYWEDASKNENILVKLDNRDYTFALQMEEVKVPTIFELLSSYDNMMGMLFTHPEVEINKLGDDNYSITSYEDVEIFPTVWLKADETINVCF